MADRPRAYHTPEEISGTTIVRILVVPVSLLTQVSGALTDLLDPDSWDEVGVTVEETVKELHDMIDLYYHPPFIGAVMAFVQEPVDIPLGWLVLDGSTIEDGAAHYPELWLIAPESWQDGADLVLPDMTARTLVGQGGSYDLGDMGGEEEITLTTPQMPSHNHIYETSLLPPLPVITPGEGFAQLPELEETVTSESGSGQPHPNMPPFLVVTWAVFAGRN